MIDLFLDCNAIHTILKQYMSSQCDLVLQMLRKFGCYYHYNVSGNTEG